MKAEALSSVSAFFITQFKTSKKKNKNKIVEAKNNLK